ncbi:MAG: DUF218 domain-containing protein [Oscillochloris sp.]|nr:DUF218 domain-containing protein [Oscillochloris sp.]
MQHENATISLTPRQLALRYLQKAARQLRWVIRLLLGLPALAITVAAGAAAVQAGRSETRAVDVAVVFVSTPPRRELILHTIDLYRRGLIDTIMPVGAQAEALKTALGEAGVPADIIVETKQSSGTFAQIQSAATSAVAGGAQRALLVSAPDELLIGLKILRDQGLQAYASPPTNPSNDPLAYLAAGIDYWRYALAIGITDDVVYSR